MRRLQRLRAELAVLIVVLLGGEIDADHPGARPGGFDGRDGEVALEDDRVRTDRGAAGEAPLEVARDTFDSLLSAVGG